MLRRVHRQRYGGGFYQKQVGGHAHRQAPTKSACIVDVTSLNGHCVPPIFQKLWHAARYGARYVEHHRLLNQHHHYPDRKRLTGSYIAHDSAVPAADRGRAGRRQLEQTLVQQRISKGLASNKTLVPWLVGDTIQATWYLQCALWGTALSGGNLAPMLCNARNIRLQSNATHVHGIRRALGPPAL